MPSNLVGATAQDKLQHTLTTQWSLHLRTCAVQACPVTACKRVSSALRTRLFADPGTPPQLCDYGYAAPGGTARSGCEAGEKVGCGRRQGVSTRNCSTWAKHMRHAACFTHTHTPREVHVGVWIPGQAGPVPALAGHASGWVLGCRRVRPQGKPSWFVGSRSFGDHFGVATTGPT